jgi:hypothetical protein
MAVTFTGGLTTPLMFGNDATTQNLFTIENGIASRVNIIVRELDVEIDTIVAVTSVMPLVKLCRATAISGGITLDKGSALTTQTSDPAVTFRSAMWEGAPIAATAGDTMWQVFAPRGHTLVEQFAAPSRIDGAANIAPEIARSKDIVVRPGQSLLVRLTASAAATNTAIGNAGNVSVVWEEDAIATFAISGTVTLSAVPVAGAIVTVVEADDTVGTNAVLREVIVTPAGGTWASSIRTGKVGAAFVQYESGGTKYTAPGSPYLE